MMAPSSGVAGLVADGPADRGAGPGADDGALLLVAHAGAAGHSHEHGDDQNITENFHGLILSECNRSD